MKSNILRIKVFAVLAIFAIFFSAFNFREKKKESFFETHQNTLWKYGEIQKGLTIYAQIKESDTAPFEIWLYNVIDDCYFNERYAASSSTEILENSRDQVKIRIEENTEEHGIFTLRIDDQNLHLELDSFKGGKLFKEEGFTLKKTNEDIDQLVECEN